MSYDLFAGELGSFGSGMEISMPDADVLHFARLFDPCEASSLFLQLQQNIEWQQQQIKLYGRVHDLPRLTAWYGDPAVTYSYSGISITSSEWVEALLEIKRRIEGVSDFSFNCVLLNRYRNGSDGVSWHADDEPELGQNPVIGSVSFGEARPFQLKHKILDEKREIILENGSYLLMKGRTQHCWLHKIPKSKRVLGERINLTFRLVA